MFYVYVLDCLCFTKGHCKC